MPDITINTPLVGRDNIAQPSGILFGREDTEYLRGILSLAHWRNGVTTVMEAAGIARVDTMDYHWFDTSPRPYIDQINFSTGFSSSDTSLTVDHAEFFTVGDLVRHQNTGEQMLVTEKAAISIGVIRDIGQSTEGWTALAGAINDNDFLFITGSTFEAGHPIPVIKHVQETEFVNFTMVHRTPWGVTEDVAESALRGDTRELDRLKAESGQFHVEGKDKIFFDGKPFRGDKGTFDAAIGNTAPSIPFGLNHYLETFTRAANLVDQTDLTLFELYDWLEVVMDKGSRTKIAFVPSNFITTLMKFADVKEQLRPLDDFLGMTITSLMWGDTRLMLKEHQYLNREGSTEFRRVFVIDVDHVQMTNFGPNGTTRPRNLDVYQATGETIVKGEWQTKFGYVFRNADAHGRLRYKTITT